MLKITKSQLKQIIKEEAELVKKEILLKRELADIEKQLSDLNEVHAGGEMAPGPEGVHAGQKKPVFKKKGTHLVEDSEEEEMSADAEMASPSPMDMDMDVVDAGADASDEGTVSKEQLKAAIGNLGTELGLSGAVEFPEVGEEEGEMGAEEITVDPEMGASGEAEMNVDIETDVPDSPEANTDEENIDECGDMSEKKTQVAETEAVVSETETPSVAAPVAESTPAPVVNENKESSQPDEKEKKRLQEVARWQHLAGIIKG